MNRKEYVKPLSQVVELENLCDSGIMTASVYKGSLKGENISRFDVIEETQTKADKDYSTLWGKNNKDNWGDD